jgi:curved DNA-binding protein CbpA
MAFQLRRGLFTSDFTDNYAILGVAVDADLKEIRKAYLKIARHLHPDSTKAMDDMEKRFAEQLLSKLVNPAWKTLSQDARRTEYNAILKLKGEAAALNSQSGDSLGGAARALLSATNTEGSYRSILSDLSARQYDDLNQMVELTAQISELNLAYLIRQAEGGQGRTSRSQPLYAQSATAISAVPRTTSASQSPLPVEQPTSRQSMAEPYFHRAETLYKRGEFVPAIRELRDAVQIDPRHSGCHSLLGMAYLQQKQRTMAKIHFNKALELDPNDEQAQKGKQFLEQAASRGSTSSAPSDPKKSSGGFLGGLFGRKKS